ncbi:PHP domain-containing protein [Bacteroides ovatus]|jgi:DNA polymerase-3 subunit alpha|uniref:PHP domain-containing protein n=1 Tax=Bacteroides ovatus TaxID=28116 RepID=UPI001B8CC8C7|nr:PHP domain-containing protein [Bacteroides ovatus]MCE8873667.1 PHP domain-containing protein [Bacteroides ovatus]QUT82708.1 Bacterial DNA polymerase III alpha NTPase domain protein [Bacteroides ovatus]DAT28027.1 MAG TPA: DNA polymerase III, alpha subunit [Caudoviricetes sp.]
MKELINWLQANKISFKQFDNEVVEIEGFGKVYVADLTEIKSIFRGTEILQFNLMENPDVLIAEGICFVAFPFGDNWYYYNLKEEFRFNILKYAGVRQPCKMQVPFVNLGVHTPFELLNGSGNITDWVRKAKYLGHTALGICDRNAMAATLNLQKECAAQGIKHVFGYTLELEHEGEKVEMKVYAQTQRGMRNLLRIQKEIMVDSDNRTLSLQGLLTHGEGNVLVLGKLSSYWLKKNPHIIKAMKIAFGQVFYQVDLSEYKAERIDVEVLNATKFFFENFYEANTGTFLIEPILLCDTYYLDKDDARNKIILNKIASGAAHEQSDDQYFKDIDEHYAIFCSLFDGNKWELDSLFKRMCSHTVEIAEGAVARYETDRNFMPQYDMTAEEKQKFGDRHRMFLSLLEEGFKKLVPAGHKDEYRKRLDYEIYILESTDNVDYLLVQYDTVNWAREHGILVGCGRGSAGGSLALYLLGITLIDPIKYDLLFERFLLPERAGLYPDEVTIIVGGMESTQVVQVTLANGKAYVFDKDAKLRVMREGHSMTVYADELKLGDDIIFDNRDLVFTLNETAYDC